jgi:hypothetical protein
VRRDRRLLDVELARLRQVRGLVEVPDREERRRALARGRRQDRRVEDDEAVRVEVLAAGADHLGAHAEQRVLPVRPDPEVPVIEEERRPVLLRRDRILGALRDDLERRHAELESDRRPRIGAHRPRDDHRRLLRKVVGEREGLRRHVGLRHHALDRAGPVADLQEVDLAARPSSGEPAAQRDRAPVVLPDALDRHHLRHGGRIAGGRVPAKLVAAGSARLESPAGGHPCSAFV